MRWASPIRGSGLNVPGRNDRSMPVELSRTAPVVMESNSRHTFPGAKEQVVSRHDTTTDARSAAERAAAGAWRGPPFFYATVDHRAPP